MSLVENINKRKKAGTSRSKKKSTISEKAYKDMQSGWQDKKSGGKINICSNRKKMMKGSEVMKIYTTENKRYGGGVPNPRVPDPMD